MRHIIIGNSAAGLSAAESIRCRKPQDEIIILSRERYPAYAMCLISEVLSGEKAADELRLRGKDFYEKNGFTFLPGATAKEVDGREKRLILEDGRRIEYDKLLIAAGSRNFVPPIDGIDKPMVFGLKSIGDAESIVKAASGSRRAVVIGAGLIGLEAAFALYRRGLEVTVVEMAPHVLPQQFDGEAAAVIEGELMAEGIRLITGAAVEQIVDPPLWSRLFGRKDKGVVLQNGQRLSADIVILAAGTRPNVELAISAGAKVNRGIVVDGYLQTTVPDIYAAGDAIEILDTISGLRIPSAIWPNAVMQGKLAGLNMAGVPSAYLSDIGMQNVVEFKDIPSIAAGLVSPTELEPKGYEVIVSRRPGHGIYRKIVLDDGVIKGFILIGDILSSGILMALMRKKANVNHIRHRLLQPDLNLADILS